MGSHTAWVLHVDLDQFVAAVEVLRRPELAGRPVVVGGRGDPTERGVVSTASYEARVFGVRSGMPLRIAARKLPDAVFLPVDAPEYEAVSERVMATLRSLGAVVEVLGWDEAFLGASTDDPEALARHAQEAVLRETRLHCSVGIGDNKVRAKIATEFGKPAGVFRLTAENWFDVMGHRPTIDLWGVGTKVSRRLTALGVTTVQELADAPPDALVAEFGPKMGVWYHELGRGLGPTTVDDAPWVPRGHSRETTFQQNLTTPGAGTGRGPGDGARGGRGHREGRPAGRPRRDQGALRAVRDDEHEPQAPRGHPGPGDDRGRGAGPAGQGRGPGGPAARRARRDGDARRRRSGRPDAGARPDLTLVHHARVLRELLTGPPEACSLCAPP